MTAHAAQDKPDDHHAPLRPVAAIVAWLLPGAGHMLIGEKKRGIAMMIGIGFLIVMGLFIGGLDCVDRKEDRLWFLAQALNGPIAFIADYANQHFIKTRPDEELLLSEGIGRVNEIGTLYIALAGLLNLAIILDALHFVPRAAPRVHHPARRAGDRPAPQSDATAAQQERS